MKNIHYTQDNYQTGICSKRKLTKNMTENIEEVTCLKCIAKMEFRPKWYIKQQADERWQNEVNKMGVLFDLPEDLSFEIKEEVSYGGFDKAVILDSYEDGKYYKVAVSGKSRDRGNYTYIRAIRWQSLHKLESYNNERVSNMPDINISYYNSELMGLLLKVDNGEFTTGGIDFSPSYQRELVWTEQDKENLIDSLFNGVDIGKFVFVKLDYSNENSLEVLDGKQRLTTLIEFWQNKFKYKGRYFYQLHPSDKSAFERYQIVRAELPIGTTLKQKLETFIRINTNGRVMDQSHLDKVEDMLKEIK